MGLEGNLLDSSKKFLGVVCGGILPLNATLCEDEGVCVLEEESCKYCKLEKGTYFCNKKTYTFIPQSVG